MAIQQIDAQDAAPEYKSRLDLAVEAVMSQPSSSLVPVPMPPPADGPFSFRIEHRDVDGFLFQGSKTFQGITDDAAGPFDSLANILTNLIETSASPSDGYGAFRWTPTGALATLCDALFETVANGKLFKRRCWVSGAAYPAIYQLFVKFFPNFLVTFTPSETAPRYTLEVSTHRYVPPAPRRHATFFPRAIAAGNSTAHRRELARRAAGKAPIRYAIFKRAESIADRVRTRHRSLRLIKSAQTIVYRLPEPGRVLVVTVPPEPDSPTY